jgi:GWxTD domain-containing protein
MRCVVIASLLIFAGVTRAAAQGPAGADALSPAAVTDSQKVLETLGARVRSNSNDAAAWYRQGMIAWALADRARAANPPRELDAQRLGRMADTSLRLAAQIERANPLYATMAGRFLLASGVALTRIGSVDFFQSAVEAARKGKDPNMLAETAVDYGRVFWRRYDAMAYRYHETVPGGGIRSIGEVMNPPCTVSITDPCPPRPIKAVRETLLSQAAPMEVDGADLVRAEALFREAYAAAPTNPRAARSLAMVYAERADWRGLEQFARGQVGAIPWDAWGWLSLGLATHRLGDTKTASAAFDSAMVLLDGGDRTRLDKLDRVLPPGDSSKAVRGSDAERAAYRRLYWAMAEPLWSRNGNQSRTEYLARVTYAELRWTVDELRLRGADTDRGDIFVRYGPPEIKATFSPRESTTDQSQMSTIWVYGTDLAFAFVGQPSFASMRTPPGDISLVHAITQTNPVRFDNVRIPTIDSMPTLIARFRGGRDSVDVLVAADIPVAKIRESQSVAGPVLGDVWFMNGSAVVTWHDSLTLKADGVRSWRRRVAQGAYLFRVQAMADAAGTAARSTGVIDAGALTADPFVMHGAAISDVLLTTSAAPRGSAAARWQDLDIVPMAGSVPHGGAIAFVWENYEFGARGGNAQYAVVATIEHQRSLLGRIGANVIGSLVGVARINRSNDRVAITFDRTMPHAAAFVDYLTVRLDDTPAGSYLLTLQVTDKVSGKVSTRTRTFTIRE